MKKRSVILTAIAATTLCFGPSLIGANTQATDAATGQVVALPYGVNEVVKMYKGGVGNDVIVNYINNSTTPYHLSADDILYLHSLGMPQEITQAMMQRDGQLQQQAPVQPYYQPQAAVAPNTTVAAQTPAQVVVPSTPAPSVTVIGSDPYYYDYPEYDYGYPLVIGGGWGWGPGWGWGHGWGWDHGFHGGFRGGFGGGGFHGGFGGGGFHGGFGGGHGGGHR